MGQGKTIQDIRKIATENREYAQGAINGVVLQDIASILESMLDRLDGDVPEIFRQYAFPVTSHHQVIDSTVIPTMPWIAFTLCNDGPESVYVFVNEKTDIMDHRDVSGHSTNVAPIKKGETIKFNIKSSGIERVFLQCDHGSTASVRIYSEGKRWGRRTQNA